MSEKKFVFSFHEERYGSEQFDSREEALAVAREEDPDEAVFTGIVAPLKLSEGCSCLMLDYAWEQIEEEFGEEVGEVAVLPKLTSVARDDLKKLIDEWATKHDLHPKFFRVDDIQVHSPDGSTRAY